MTRARAAVLAACVLLALGALWVPGLGRPAAPGTRTVVVNANQYAYTPSVIRVPRGERVTLILEADDVTHGLYLDGYGVDTVAAPGRRSTLEFLADRAGKFRFRCSKVCGNLHPFMVGELIVEPNAPFWRAAGLAVLAAAGTLAFLWAGPARGRA